MRVAIVGCGPKGLFALERVLAHAGRVESPLEIDVFDPDPNPGAGPVYGPGQPDYLRMNYSSRQVDMWWRAGGPVTPGERPTFSEWRGNPSDDYAPRAEVGGYLTDGLRRLVETAPDGVAVDLRPRKVDSVHRAGERWAVRSDGKVAGDFDRVLLATGHEQFRQGVVTADTDVDARGTIAIRGFALTFIDAALSLTEGRGGEFVETDGGRLQYRSRGEPVRILPFSRTGKAMLAKPPRQADDEDLESQGRMLMAEVATPLTDVEGQLTPVLSALLEAGADLGGAWRAIYPSVVRNLSGRGIADDQWPAFLRLSAELERAAFGPPPINAAKLRALVSSGVVDLGHLTDPPDEADAVIDAVTPGPGVPARGLLRDLVRDGLVRVAPGRRGIETSGACECIGEDGLPSRGLAAYGRPTEDWVIGNDTLSRSLHPQIDGWAEDVAVSGARVVRA
jgi:uncharacterized NAD(P)/FAD-binding protein YdhS